MSDGVYEYLIGEDGVRQFAMHVVDDQVKSIAVFAKNPDDAKFRPGETVFARSDIYALTAGASEKLNGFNATSGCSLTTHIYKIKADHAGDAIRVKQAACTYYCFGEVHEAQKTATPFLGFTATNLSRQHLRDNGFGNYNSAILVPLPQRMIALAHMEAAPNLPFHFLKQLPIPMATLARDGIEQSLLPKAAPDPIWIAPDNMTLANNYSRITKNLRKRAP